MSHRVLPDQFRELELFVTEWALATEKERNEKRLSSTMADLQAFYQAMLPRLEEVLNYLSQFTLDQMPEEARRLFYLSLSMAEVSPAIELFKQPSVPDTLAASRFIPVHTQLQGILGR
jgi:hypothetical protein